MTTTYIIIGVSVLLIIFLVSAYNRFVTYKNNRENAFADIDVQLKQRHDLIPQLIGSVKGYMDHEREAYSHELLKQETRLWVLLQFLIRSSQKTNYHML